MKFERLYNSKFFIIVDFVYKLIILNLLLILTTVFGLVVFSLMPALIALIIILKSLRHDRTFPLVQTYFRVIRANYRKIIKLSLFYTLLGCVFVFNTLFFYLALQESQPIFYQLAFYGMIVVDVVFLLAAINSCFVFVYFPNLTNRKIIKYSFVLLTSIPLQSLVVVLLLLMSVGLLYVFPIILIFIWPSICVFLIHISIRNTYERFVTEGVKSIDALDYEFQSDFSQN